MITDTVHLNKQGAAREHVPSLVEGQRLTQPEFHRRYKAMEGLKAELVEGVVHMASPVGPGHGDAHSCLTGTGKGPPRRRRKQAE